MPADRFENRPVPNRSQRSACFAVLGLPATADVHDVTRAYRKLAVTRHPDSGGDAESFNELEIAYRECMRQARMQPRVSGQPSRDNFRPALPRMLRRPVAVCATLTMAILYALAAWRDTRLAILGLVVMGPLALGALVSMLRPSWSLLVSGVMVAAIGIAWVGAIYQLGWISYAFKSVPISSTDYAGAVTAAKRWELLAAITMTVLSLLMIGMGCTAAVLREKR